MSTVKKRQNKEKEAVNGPFLKQRIFIVNFIALIFRKWRKNI